MYRIRGCDWDCDFDFDFFWEDCFESEDFDGDEGDDVDDDA